MAKITPKLKESLEKMHYEVVGNHSAVEICSWCKKSLLDDGVCYKQQFYGIRSHMCCQMTPTAGYCNQKCIFCWRPQELNCGISMDNNIDDPKDIIEGCKVAQIKKLSGFGGNEKANQEKFKQAQEPMHFAISLSGEPTLYPKLPELIKEIHKQGKTTFLVTNGTQPEMLQKLKDNEALPTQLYVSLDEPNEDLYYKIDVPVIKDGWERLNKTLELMPKLDTRKVIRITLIKDVNDVDIKGYTKLIKKAQPHFIEVKAYMFVGYSRKRMKKENMPTHKEIKEFSEKLAKELGWKILDEHERSRVCLIAKEDYPWRIMKFN